MSLNKSPLFSLVAPPCNSDLAVTSQEWARLSKMLDVNLPDEWSTILNSYGNGVFHGSELSITIYNPADLKSQAYIFSRNLGVKSIAATLDYKDFPFSVYPEPQGLFFFGQDDNAYRLFWNPIDAGCVVAYPRLEEFRVFPRHTIDVFLFEVLSGQRTYVNFPEQGEAWFERCTVWIPEV